MKNFLNESVQDHWNSITQNYSSDQSNILWRTHSDAVNAALITSWLPSGTPVQNLLKTDLFDEALGDGLYNLLQSKARNVMGIDISDRIQKSAKSRHNRLKSLNADVRYLPFMEKTFDIIISISTLDHFNTKGDIFNSLLEIKRVLRENGQLIITLDNLYNPVIALRALLPFRLMNRLSIVPYYVGVTLSLSQLRRTLAGLGFDVTEVTAVMHCPRVFAVLLAKIFYKYAGVETRRQFLGILTAFERMADLPVRFLTGHFIAIRAVKQVQ